MQSEERTVLVRIYFIVRRSSGIRWEVNILILSMLAMDAFDEFVMQNGVFAQIVAMLGLYLWLGIAFYQKKVEFEIFSMMNTDIEAESEDDYGELTTEWDQLDAEEKWKYRQIPRWIGTSSIVPGIMTIAGGFIWFYAETELEWSGLSYNLISLVAIVLLLGFAFYIYLALWLKYKMKTIVEVREKNENN